MTELQQLVMPLSCSQIEAAARFWKEGGWETKEIGQLKRAFPNYREAVKLKAITINALYGTHIIAISQVADCIEQFLTTKHSTGSNLVEDLVAEIKKITNKQHHSFAAKYAHFFINPDLPILDWYAEAMLSQHLGSMTSKNPKRYLKFVEDIRTLKQVAGLTCNCADLDAYLWVAGEYWYWKEHHTSEINGDLKLHFERLARDPESERTLCNLLGVSMDSALASLLRS
jgi:hypothetical protein